MSLTYPQTWLVFYGLLTQQKHGWLNFGSINDQPCTATAHSQAQKRVAGPRRTCREQRHHRRLTSIFTLRLPSLITTIRYIVFALPSLNWIDAGRQFAIILKGQPDPHAPVRLADCGCCRR